MERHDLDRSGGRPAHEQGLGRGDLGVDVRGKGRVEEHVAHGCDLGLRGGDGSDKLLALHRGRLGAGLALQGSGGVRDQSVEIDRAGGEHTVLVRSVDLRDVALGEDLAAGGEWQVGGRSDAGRGPLGLVRRGQRLTLPGTGEVVGPRTRRGIGGGAACGEIGDVDVGTLGRRRCGLEDGSGLLGEGRAGPRRDPRAARGTDEHPARQDEDGTGRTHDAGGTPSSTDPAPGGGAALRRDGLGAGLGQMHDASTIPERGLLGHEMVTVVTGRDTGREWPGDHSRRLRPTRPDLGPAGARTGPARVLGRAARRGGRRRARCRGPRCPVG